MKPKILVFDIETAPILAYVWGLWDQNVPLNQIKKDWHVLSWAAKWYGESEIFYRDQRDARNIEDDKAILKEIWKLLDEADVVLTQNGKKFDQKKLNTRFILNKMKPPSSFQHIDTLTLAKKHFGFTSNKLEYMTEKLCVKYKKLKHEKFSGFELWNQVLKGNLDAWDEMEKYNKHDVLSLEELYSKMAPWDTSFNPNVYSEDGHQTCTCGSTFFMKYGFRFTKNGKYQRFVCKNCGAQSHMKYTEKRSQYTKGD